MVLFFRFDFLERAKTKPLTKIENKKKNCKIDLTVEKPNIQKSIIRKCYHTYILMFAKF